MNGGILNFDVIPKKYMFYGVNGVNVVQGCHIGVTIKIQSQFAPFMF